MGLLGQSLFVLAQGAESLYDRIMNLLKHFLQGLDSAGKLAIMVLALRNKEC